MELSHIIVLALVQGISEFLPVSSSAHLVLVPKLLGWADQGRQAKRGLGTPISRASDVKFD